MPLHASSIAPCQQCRGVRPHLQTRQGLRCMGCGTRRRRQQRREKGERIGTRRPQPVGLETWAARCKLADDLYSIALRARHAVGLVGEPRDLTVVHHAGCEMCGACADEPQRMQCAHGWSRRFYSIRFHPANTFSLCSQHHREFTPKSWAAADGDEAGVAIAWRGWCERAVGPEAWSLVCAARSCSKRGLDLEAIALDARIRIDALPAGPVREWAQEREHFYSRRAA